MSEMNPIEREQKKKQLRGRVIDTATQDMFPRRGISGGESRAPFQTETSPQGADGGVNRGAFGGWFYVL